MRLRTGLMVIDSPLYGPKTGVTANEVLLTIQKVDDQVANILSNLEIQPHTKIAPIVMSEEFREPKSAQSSTG